MFSKRKNSATPEDPRKLARSPGAAPVSSIGAPFNLQHKVHVNKDLNWIGEDPAKIFLLADKLGEGAYGAVYKAVHRDVPTFIVAVKQVFVGLGAKESEGIKKEIDILKQCKSRYIVNYYGSCTKDEYLWILMDYCSLGSLRDVMSKIGRSLTENEIAEVMKSCLCGLEYLHTCAIVHRDVKAANILLTEHAEVKIADFGVSDQLCTTLFPGTFIGTPLWMAPEMIKKSKYNHRADVWSLGITAIELADGEPPYADAHPLHAMFKIPHKPPPTVKHPEKWSPDFINFIAQCCIKDYTKRPSANELLQHSFILGAKGSVILKPLILEAMSAKPRQDIKKRNISWISFVASKVKKDTTPHAQLEQTRRPGTPEIKRDPPISFPSKDTNGRTNFELQTLPKGFRYSNESSSSYESDDGDQSEDDDSINDGESTIVYNSMGTMVERSLSGDMGTFVVNDQTFADSDTFRQIDSRNSTFKDDSFKVLDSRKSTLKDEYFRIDSSISKTILSGNVMKDVMFHERGTQTERSSSVRTLKKFRLYFMPVSVFLVLFSLCWLEMKRETYASQVSYRSSSISDTGVFMSILLFVSLATFSLLRFR
eukprot:TRINITY_DN5273_c0_g1_i1.p1 TRINITY_DN5273_c0_g1~~TRINITY_DN5273_c0_g1_i1.p1  ORF type:complete len:595 (-),score=98.33 TRINITY_DN5273_c0_g1_i1:107-1891(-)